MELTYACYYTQKAYITVVAAVSNPKLGLCA